MKLKLFLMIALVTVIFSGCVSVSRPVETDKSFTFPSDGQCENLGEIYLKDEMVVALWGLVWVGGAQYEALLLAAKEKYGLVDDVVNIQRDEHIYSFLGFLSVVKITLRGTAIRYLPAVTPVE